MVQPMLQTFRLEPQQAFPHICLQGLSGDIIHMAYIQLGHVHHVLALCQSRSPGLAFFQGYTSRLHIEPLRVGSISTGLGFLIPKPNWPHLVSPRGARGDQQHLHVEEDGV